MSFEQTREAVSGKSVRDVPVKWQEDAVGCAEAFRYAYELAAEGCEVSELEIRRIHSLVLKSDPENAGIYRDAPVTISGAPLNPPHCYMIRPLMREMLEDFRLSGERSLRKIARMHSVFEWIHPFNDGNGRTGRILMDIELIKLGAIPVSVRIEDRDFYCGSFDAFNSNNRDESADMLERIVSGNLKRNYALAERFGISWTKLSSGDLI